MFVNYLFIESAFEHKITEIDIRTAFERPIFDGLLKGYQNKFLLTGFDTKGNLLEIMYNIVNEETVQVFHAMTCRKEYRTLRNQY